MSYNYLDKTGLTHFWDKIKGIFLRLSGGTMTGQLKTSFKSSVAIGSYSPSAITIPNLCTELRYSSGCMGSFSLGTAYTYSGVTIPTGWYNFLWVPHRSGGVNGEASGDNCDYGALMLWGMNNANGMFRIRYSNGSVQECRKITDNSMLGSYIANSNSYINTHPENSPVLIPFIHNDIAFLLKRGGSAKIYYDNVQQTLDISNVFDGSPSYWAINPTGTTEIIIELTLHQVFAWTNTIYCDFGSSGWRSKSVKIEVMNTNYASDVWTSKLNTTTNGSGNIKTTFNHTPVGASNAGGGFNKIRFTFSNWNTATIFRISQLGVYNYGSNGVRETYMSRGIDDYVFRNITPDNNNAFNLGDNNHKWANVYATTFQGNATSATKATQDEHGNNIANTYATHQDISGKVDKVSGKGLSTNDYTTTEKTKLSGIATGAEVNQNAFSNVKVGNTTIQADSKTDTLELVAGNNITLTPNSTNDSVTISATSGGGDNEAQLYNFVCSSVIPGGNNTNDIFVIDVDTDIRPNTFVYDSTATYTNVKLGFDSTLFEQCYWTDRINIRLVKNNTTLKEFGVYRKDSRDISVDYLNTWGVWEYGSNMIFNAIFDCSNSVVKILGQNLLHYDDVIEPMRELYNMVIGKQDKLSSQTAYSAKGTSTKVPQITTNSLGQVTNITEVDISGGSGTIGSSNNTIENVVSLTKAEYDALQTKETKTLYNITDDVTEPSVTRGSATANSTYISAVENNHWERIGKVVSYSFTMTAGGTWTTNNMFASGLPKPVAALRFVGINHNKNVPMRFQLTADGQLGNAWSGTTPVSGNQLEGQVTYITNDP